MPNLKSASTFPNRVNCFIILCSFSCVLRFKQIQKLRTPGSKLRLAKAYQLFRLPLGRRCSSNVALFCFFPSESGHGLRILLNTPLKAATRVCPRHHWSRILFAILHRNPSHLQRPRGSCDELSLKDFSCTERLGQRPLLIFTPQSLVVGWGIYDLFLALL